jgi:hypothetical protein
MFMVCAMALVLRTDKAVENGGSILEKVSKPAPAKTPAKAVVPAPAPQSAPQPAAPAPKTQF